MRAGWVAAGVALAIACGSEPEPPEPGPEPIVVETAAAEPEPETPPEPPPPDWDAMTHCTRALACCEAYADAMGGAPAGMSHAQVCLGVTQAADAGEAGERACLAAIAGWRTTLREGEMPLPPPCEDLALE